MTAAEFRMYLLASAVLCFVLAAFNLLRPKKKVFLGIAMVTAGLAMLGYRVIGEGPLVYGLGAVTFLGLVFDVVDRMRNIGARGTP